ncbi:spermidine synthase [Micromonospora sp. DR5-3]|uniref:spermine/spermidine synthase domain-containing protein n=1 Tax=unclassified Micromonospora TaxID=2617518 RepID=UPI0011D4D5D5|nr:MULTISPECIES: spermidine synthase [unclassified Micromonospora]MCW3816689.1 spermidine synthase [Micromonospora sp. DR5-3]TYC22553.1 spermidine synthase [Micromonospora sp. MP36]
MNQAVAVVDRVVTERGELVLRQCGGHFEIVSNGVFLMDTRAGASERLLVRKALEVVRPGARVLIGGLGVGFSLAEAAASAVPAEIVVLEIEETLIGWHRHRLAPWSGHALRDARVRVVNQDVLTWLRATDEVFDAICLDIDNGPDWTVFPGNATLYDADGTALLRDRLAADGVLAVWSASAAPAYAERLAELIGPVSTHPVAVPRGEPDVVYLARRGGPRRP